MKTVNIYDAKTNFSKLIQMVQRGEKVTIAKSGVRVVDLVPHKPKKAVVFGGLKGKIHYTLVDFEGTDQDIQRMFYK